MIQETIDQAVKFKTQAQNLRDDAKESEDNDIASDFYEEAIEEHEKAVEVLRSMRDFLMKESKWASLSPENQHELLRKLSGSYGSLAGTWRDFSKVVEDDNLKKEHLEHAIKNYDKGYEIEKERIDLLDDHDSYNLLQRLVVRLLRDHDALENETTEAGFDLNVPEALKKAKEIIMGQKRKDSWGKADLVMARYLCKEDAQDDLDELESMNPGRFFYESTHEVVKDLIEAKVGSKIPVVQKGLLTFKHTLERRGGIAG